jgi:hypothetical protein
MIIGKKLQSAAESLMTAADVLHEAANAYPALEGLGREFERITQAAIRPLRIGIVGETNSGKSSLANILAGVAIMPAHPVHNTGLPTLLKYASAPSVAIIYESGENIALPVKGDLAQLLTSLYDCGGNIKPPARKKRPAGAVKRLEVGLPRPILHSLEILDFPGCAGILSTARDDDPLAHDIDAAIWTTVATQAWRASEQRQWLDLPEAIRSRSLLAVTYCDQISGGKRDIGRLQNRLDASAMPYFRGICLVNARDADPAAAAAINESLFAHVERLTQDLPAERLDDVLGIAQGVLKEALETSDLPRAYRAPLRAWRVGLALAQQDVRTNLARTGLTGNPAAAGRGLAVSSARVARLEPLPA